MTDCRETGIPFSNSPQLHDSIGNRKTDKNELARAAFENAEQFYIGAALIFKESIDLIQVVSVNLAFACELYLKSMLYKLDISFGRSHRVSDLYRLLSEEIQKKIKEKVSFRYETKDNFELVLEEISDAFVFLRYAHERKAVVTSWDGLSSITTAIMLVARGTVIETEGKQNSLNE